MTHSSKAHRHVVRVGGTEVHWAEIGEGPPLVLIHGLADSHRTWDPVVPRLSRRRRVLMPDLAGHGLSGRPDASYGVAWHAELMATWMTTIGLEEVDVVGHSYGGGVAQWLLLSGAPRVRRLGLVSAGGLGRDVALVLRLASLVPMFERLGQPLMGPATRAFMKVFQTPFTPDEVAALSWMNAMPGTAAAFARTVRDVIGFRGQRRRFWDRAHELPSLPPTALFWGEDDPIIPLSHGAELSLLVDGVALSRFERCGHYPHREHSEAFCDALERFLDDAELEPARIRRTLSVPPRPHRLLGQALVLRDLAARMRRRLREKAAVRTFGLRRSVDVQVRSEAA
jgi:pimeloyl-ACP methyl ester carboxylesterase